MTHERIMHVSERWFRLLLYFYPVDFRDELGTAIVDAYRDRAHQALTRRSVTALAAVWLRAALDSLWNGPAERVRPAASWRRDGNWGRDLQMARRRLTRAPLFVAATVGTLAVGLAAFAVVYTAVDKILIEPLPYRAPQDLYFVWRDQSAASGVGRDWLSGPDVAELQHAAGDVIESVAGMQLVAPTFSAGPDSEPLQVTAMLTSPNLFDLLGVAPAFGRVFTAQEVGPDRPSVIVLSHALWNRLGADPAVVGRTVWLSGTSYTVVGVMGPTFRFVRHASVGPPQEADAYLPFRFHVADQDPNGVSFAALIRVRPGTSVEQAAAAVDAAGRAVIDRHHQNRPYRLYSVGLHADLVARIQPVLFTLGLAGAFLVLVLAVNLASLLLARAAAREREFAVSRAVGANGRAIVRAMLLEGAFLGFAGGAAGALMGRWGAAILVALTPVDLPRRDGIALDWSVASIVIAVGILLGLVAAVVPAAWASRVSLGSLLATSTVRGAGGVVPMRRAMIVAQIAISLVLLSAGGLVVRSFQQLLAADPGFNPAGVLTFNVAMGPRLFPKPADALLFQDRLETALRTLPQVSDVSATTGLPLSASAQPVTITFPGAPGNTGDMEHDAPLVDLVATRARYVDVMGMRVEAGRGFDTARRNGVHEALIDTHLVRQFFPTGTPLGASIRFNGQMLTIVGIVSQARLYDLHQDGRPQVYVRAEDWTPYTPSFVLRTNGDPRAVLSDIPRVIREIDSRLPVSSLRTMDEIVNDAQRQQRISAVLIAGFAIGALLLVAMGLFGMISGSIAQRHGELAVRLALGATHGRVLRLIVREGALLVAAGILIAMPGIYVAGGVLRGLLIGVSPLDPLTLLAVTAGLMLVTIAACYVPARRVLTIDPAPLLRQQ
jgi:putative ABC transport system permease protein